MAYTAGNTYYGLQKCSQYCCGDCFNRYCCFISSSEITNQDDCPNNKEDYTWLNDMNYSLFNNFRLNLCLIFERLIISVFGVIALCIIIISACCISKRRKNRRIQQAIAQQSTTSQSPPQPQNVSMSQNVVHPQPSSTLPQPKLVYDIHQDGSVTLTKVYKLN